MDPKKVTEIAQATSNIPTIAWISIIIIGLIIITILIIVNLDKISKLLFGDKKGILIKEKTQDLSIESHITTYISSWSVSIKFSESLKISNLENLLEFLKNNLNELNTKKVSAKKLFLDLSDTDKINSTAAKDITSFIEIVISEYQTVELIIELSKEPSEQLKMASSVWSSLIDSFKIGGRSDINVSVICNK